MTIRRHVLLNYIAVAMRVDAIAVAKEFDISTRQAAKLLKNAFDADDLMRHKITVATARKTYEYMLKNPKVIQDRRIKDLKSHEIAMLVNELTIVAKKYGHAQSCRQAIRAVVLKHLEFLPSPKRCIP